MITISMAWGRNLSVNDRYQHSGRPRLRPEVASWQEELAWELKSSIATLEIVLGPQVVVDVEMYFPKDGRVRDPDNYLKSICDGVEAGSRVDDSNFIPYVREVHVVDEAEAGFVIRIYNALFRGHGLTGTLRSMPSGEMIIILDDDLSSEWDGAEVMVNLGVIRKEEDVE